MASAMIKVAQNHDLNVSLGNAAYDVGAKSNTWADYAQRLHSEYKKRLS
jgi:hypothetical protein